MSPTFTDDEVGKTVENAAGEEIGIVTAVEGGTAYVEPDPGITDSIKAALGWESEPEDAVPLAEDDVGQVTSDAIRLETESADAWTGTAVSTDRSGETEPGGESRTESAQERGATEEMGGADRMDPVEETGGAGEMGSTEEPGTTEEMGGAGEMGGAEEIESVEDEASRDLEVDPTELTDRDPEAEVRPDEDVGRRTDAEVEPDDIHETGDEPRGPTTEDRGESDPVNDYGDPADRTDDPSESRMGSEPEYDVDVDETDRTTTDAAEHERPIDEDEPGSDADDEEDR